MDEFKKYLRQNKEKMEFDAPSPVVWENIRKSQKAISFFWLRYAVAACILGIVFMLGFFKNNKITQSTQLAFNQKTHAVNIPKHGSNDLAVNKTEAAEFHDQIETRHKVINPVRSVSKAIKKKDFIGTADKESSVAESFGEMQKSFGIIINYQLEKIKSTPLYGEDDNYFSVFKKDFQDLNSDEQSVKNEIIQKGLSDVAIQKLISVYQQKILLLKRLQGEITKVNAHAPKTENTQQQKTTYINL
ncbi:MAG: hypothetical protein NVS3B19_07460 [Ginsengibacter sp.]